MTSLDEKIYNSEVIKTNLQIVEKKLGSGPGTGFNEYGSETLVKYILKILIFIITNTNILALTAITGIGVKGK